MNFLTVSSNSSFSTVLDLETIPVKQGRPFFYDYCCEKNLLLDIKIEAKSWVRNVYQIISKSKLETSGSNYDILNLDHMYLVARLVGILHVKIIKFCNGVMSRREEEGDDRVKMKKCY